MGNPSDNKKFKDKKCKVCSDILVGDDEKNRGTCDDCYKENPPCLSDPAIENAKEKSDTAFNQKKKEEKLQQNIKETLQPELPLDSKQDLKEIAKGIHRGEIFTSNHVRQNESPDILGMIFMPLVFMNEKDRKDLIEKKVTVFYANMKDAAPRSINGYPIFFSMSYLTDAEWLKVLQYLKKLEKFEKDLEV